METKKKKKKLSIIDFKTHPFKWYLYSILALFTLKHHTQLKCDSYSMCPDLQWIVNTKIIAVSQTQLLEIKSWWFFRSFS